VDNKKNQLKLEFATSGTEGYSNLGDVSIPSGTFFATLGWLGGDPRNNPSNASVREGMLTVVQRGFHTGFYRKENRIGKAG